MNNRYSSAPSKSAAAPARGAAPLKVLRIGRIKAAVWENTAEKGTFHNVTFARLYIDQDKKFHDTDSFGRDDLLVLSKLADQAHTFVCERMAAAKSGGEPE
jgi:hypothetical protein